jgi:ABC-2 type transport system ATP-binding protein
VRQRIGYIGQKHGAGFSYRVQDELLMQGRFYGLSKSEAAARGEELFASLGLDGMEMRKVSTLSGGQQRRLDIALGLIHSPGMLFLDEPSTGMDPQNRANVWEHIMRLREQHGTTIVLTTPRAREVAERAGEVTGAESGTVTLRAESGDRVLPGLLAALANRQVAVQAATLHQPTLDDVFLNLTGRSLREGVDA